MCIIVSCYYVHWTFSAREMKLIQFNQHIDQQPIYLSIYE